MWTPFTTIFSKHCAICQSRVNFFFFKIKNTIKLNKRKNKTTSDDAMILKLHKTFKADDN